MKVIQIKMSNGSLWLVPLDVIASNRARVFAEASQALPDGLPYQTVYESEYNMGLHDHETILQWFSENIIWDDIASIAECVKEADPLNYDAEIYNGEKEIIDVDTC